MAHGLGMKMSLAGKEWFRIVIKRNPELSFHAARATSLTRVTSFNKIIDDYFYDNLTIVMDRDNIEPQDIYNTDETSKTTFHHVGSVTSANM